MSEPTQAIQKYSNSKVDEPTDFQALERLDEAQIVAELQGAVLDTYVYSFQSGGRVVTGLSWAGVKAVAAKIGAIQCDLLQLITADDAYICVVKATAPDQSSRIGAAEQAKTFQGKPDPFALPKAISKAQRNAIRALLPESLIAEVVKMRAEQAKALPAQPRPTMPQPSPSPKANDNGHWISDPKIQARFWTWTRNELKLTANEVHEALGVKSVKDFPGTATEAKTKILGWIDARAMNSQAQDDAAPDF